MSGMRSLCIGASGCGKTTFTKECLQSKPKEMPVKIYDPNCEYQEFYPEELVDFDVFLYSLVGTDKDTKRHYLVFEEATIFFNNRADDKAMRNLLVRARHTGNIIQLNFHSFASVPKGIYNLIDYVIIFKTNDNEKSVTDRFDDPGVLEAFYDCRKSNDPHIHKMVKVNKSIK